MFLRVSYESFVFFVGEAFVAARHWPWTRELLDGLAVSRHFCFADVAVVPCALCVSRMFIYTFYTWLIVLFCLFVNVLYEWNVTTKNSCVHLNGIAE